jgi:hypothetical protein
VVSDVSLTRWLATGRRLAQRGWQDAAREGEEAMVKRAAASSPVVFQARVTLEWTDPPIWRLLQLPGRLTLAQVHTAIQVAMGWHDQHLHSFEIDGQQYGLPEPGPGAGFGPREKDERKTRLADVVRTVGVSFHYTYDFGDSWEHLVEIVDVADPDTDTRSVTCLAGELACPPEDCGGVPGYYDLCAAMAEPGHPDREELTEWLGRAFAPEVFDLAATNSVLARLR